MTPTISSRKRRRTSDFLPVPRKSRSSLPSGMSTRRKKLEISDYCHSAVATRLLSCGEGEQIGHPNRTVTRKPRAVDTFPDGTVFVQVAAGGVHSVVLTSDGKVYSCGINEKGTVPVKGLEAEGVTDTFTEIVFSPEITKLGKPVQVVAGASFSAALTEKGSVIAWGNLRDSQGEVTVHETLSEIQKTPTVIIRHAHKVIVKIAAGENHLIMLSNEGEVLTFGEGSVGQLGRHSRTQHIRSKYMVDDTGRTIKAFIIEHHKYVHFVDVFACGFWSITRTEDGRLFACGQNNFGQLGIQTAAPPPPFSQIKEGNHNGVGNEEGNVITLFTYSSTFLPSKNWTHIAGVHHIVCRSDDGELYAIGKNTDNALGIGTWEGNSDDVHWRYDILQRVCLPNNEKAAGVTASLGTTIVWTEDGKVYGFGCDTVGQLGLGIKDDEEKVVPTPRLIHSAHLDDFKVVEVSMADNHALFLAVEKGVNVPTKPTPGNNSNKINGNSSKTNN